MTKYVQKDLVGEHLDHNRHDPREKGPIRNDRHKNKNFIRFPKLFPKPKTTVIHGSLEHRGQWTKRL